MDRFEPEIGRAAVTVLEAAGYRVLLGDHQCCGRPAFSQGLLDDVRGLAARNVAALMPHVRDGVPIVCLEPSCTSMVGGDYRELVTGEGVQRVADQVTSLEGFLAHLLESEPGALRLRRSATPILLHPHCHSRAVEGVEPALAVLRRLGCVTDLDAGCCGMAGTFGYQTAHYDLSVRVGSRLAARLHPESRDCPVVASGISCRHQIRDLTGRVPRHLAVLLAEALS